MAEEAAGFRTAVGATINRLRADRGWSLAVLHQRTGLSVSYLSELEHGLKEPSGASLEALGAAFGLSLGDLLRAVANTLEPQPALPPGTLRDLDEPRLAELARFADWLRWRCAPPA